MAASTPATPQPLDSDAFLPPETHPPAYSTSGTPEIPLLKHSYQDLVTLASSSNSETRISFWRTIATELLDWTGSDFKNVIGDIGGKSCWFEGGELNVCYNAVDRHALVEPDRPALLYEGNGLNESAQVSYGELLVVVSKFANVLKEFGVGKGDVVSIYLPVCVEAIIAMLGCARIGAVHCVVFGAFRGDALQFRINDCKPSVVITANGYGRAGKTIEMKKSLDEVLSKCESVKRVIVCRISDAKFQMVEGRDGLFSDWMERASPECGCVPVAATDPLCIIYTSGSTGPPKGIIHRAGGYAVAAALTHRFVFSIRPNDRFGCTSDLGWITGHTYVCYGPLLNGVATLVFSGLPLYPDATRPWQLINSLRLTHFYTSPSAARAIAASKDLKGVDDIDISSLRVLGSVGETLDEATFQFLYEKLGRKNCSVVDTYWQTEMGSIIATAVPGHLAMRPGFVGQPLFGTELVLLDPATFEVLASTSEPRNVREALLCIAQPWPGLANCCINDTEDHDKFNGAYIVPGTRFFSSGDLASYSDGYLRITGRTDDQLCVNGHRVGPAEVEAVIMGHAMVREAAVVGVPHPMSGQSIVAFAVSENKGGSLATEIKTLVSEKFSAIGRPSAVYVVDDLPKTTSEKIVRVLLRALVTHTNMKDPPTLKNPQSVEQIEALLAKVPS
jgi:acetyl-CoA synthetase